MLTQIYTHWYSYFFMLVITWVHCTTVVEIFLWFFFYNHKLHWSRECSSQVHVHNNDQWMTIWHNLKLFLWYSHSSCNNNNNEVQLKFQKLFNDTGISVSETSIKCGIAGILISSGLILCKFHRNLLPCKREIYCESWSGRTGYSRFTHILRNFSSNTVRIVKTRQKHNTR